MAGIEIWGARDQGLVRTNNEDDCRWDEHLRVAIVADGMGGAACGEVASFITVAAILDYLAARPPGSFDLEQLKCAVREANRRVRLRTDVDPACRGMGSTVVVAHWDLPRLFVLNVGDSRAYLWRRGAMGQLSIDQTLVNELRTRANLTEEQLNEFPHKHVLTMAIGSAPDPMIWSHQTTLEPDDQVLLCTDGLSGPVTDEGISAILGQPVPARQKVELLVQAAKDAGGPDNITVILLRYHEDRV